MTELDDARQLLASYFPQVSLAWFGCDERRERRVDAFLAGAADDASAFYVISLRIDGCFVAEAGSKHPHLPYEVVLLNAKPPRSEATGVFVTTWPVYPVGATQARFTHRGAIRTAPVRAGHCALFDWDTAWLATDDRPQPAALLVDGAWQSTVSPLVAATREEFRHSYVAYANSECRGDDWASNAFFDTGTFADKLAMVECILEADDLSTFGRGFLAAGPVEELIGTELLDYLERNAAARARFVPLLRGTYWSSEPPFVRRRLRELLGLPAESD